MKSFKGTPGPWFVESKKNIEVSGDMNVIKTHGVDVAGYHIAYVSGWVDDEKTIIEAKANVSLMASSPEMLSALQHLVEVYDSEDGKQWTTTSKREALDKAREAIKLALGE